MGEVTQSGHKTPPVPMWISGSGVGILSEKSVPPERTPLISNLLVSHPSGRGPKPVSGEVELFVVVRRILIVVVGRPSCE